MVSFQAGSNGVGEMTELTCDMLVHVSVWVLGITCLDYLQVSPKQGLVPGAFSHTGQNSGLVFASAGQAR